MLGRLPILALILLAGFIPECLLGQNRVPEFRARFAQETDAVRRAQMMPRLGEVEFDEITRYIDAEKLPEALALLREYRDQIEFCEKGLNAMNIDAEKHPKGYKQLEISLRQSLRKLNNLLVGLAGDEQAPFREVQKDLEEINRHLIRELFPKGAE